MRHTPRRASSLRPRAARFSATAALPACDEALAYVLDDAETRVYTVKKLGKKNIGVVYVYKDWGIQTKDFYVKELEKLGAKVVATEVVYDKDTDFKAQLTKVKASNPEVLAILNDNREREAKDQVHLVVKDGKWQFLGRQTY